MILDSRTDIEDYFIEAFYESKNEIKSYLSHEQINDKSLSKSKIS